MIYIWYIYIYAAMPLYFSRFPKRAEAPSSSCCVSQAFSKNIGEDWLLRRPRCHGSDAWLSQRKRWGAKGSDDLTSVRSSAAVGTFLSFFFTSSDSSISCTSSWKLYCASNVDWLWHVVFSGWDTCIRHELNNKKRAPVRMYKTSHSGKRQFGKQPCDNAKVWARTCV